jgi:uncharacterized protein with GYD domain
LEVVYMPTYITLLRWTDQGIRNVKEAPQRLDAARKAYEEAGGSLNAYYLVLGDYDGVSIAELPDDEAYTRAILSICAGGNVRTSTLKAFPEEEYRRIVSSLA